jgi:hypothetical protein
VASMCDVRLIVDGDEIGRGLAKRVGRAGNRACWSVHDAAYGSTWCIHTLSQRLHSQPLTLPPTKRRSTMCPIRIYYETTEWPLRACADEKELPVC